MIVLLARVLFDYVKDEENEMDLKEGEIIERVEQIDGTVFFVVADATCADFTLL